MCYFHPPSEAGIGAPRKRAISLAHPCTPCYADRHQTGTNQQKHAPRYPYQARKPPASSPTMSTIFSLSRRCLCISETLDQNGCLTNSSQACD